MSLQTAEAVLFIGKSVRVLRRTDGRENRAGLGTVAVEASARPSSLVEMDRFDGALRALRSQPIIDHIEFDRVVEDMRTEV
jgi:hypothetical protein